MHSYSLITSVAITMKKPIQPRSNTPKSLKPWSVVPKSLKPRSEIAKPPKSPVAKSGKKAKKKYEAYWCVVCRIWIGGGKALVSKHLRNIHDYEDCEIVYITSTGMLKVDKEDFLPEGAGSQTSKDTSISDDEEISPKTETFIPPSKEVSFSSTCGLSPKLEDSGIDLSVSFDDSSYVL